jgi:uncharacterized membrane protein
MPDPPEIPSFEDEDDDDGDGDERHSLIELQRELSETFAAKWPKGGPVDPDELAQMVVSSTSLSYERSSVWQGPVPSPKSIGEYEQHMPGSAKWIFERADREQNFRHEMVRRQQDYDDRALGFQAIKTFIGQGGAFLLGGGTIAGGIYLIAQGMSTGGLTALVGGVGALLTVYFTHGKSGKATSGKAEPDSDTSDDE